MQVFHEASADRALRVLVADDDPVMRTLVRANLEGRFEDVTEAADGQIAWDLLLTSTFDLALIDLSMPGIDGYTLIRCIRSHPRTRHLPIVVITSSTDRASVTAALAAGATSFMTKPINWSFFAHQIDCLLRTDESRSFDRVSRQRAEAVARAKDALIAALAVRVRRQAQRLTQLAETEMRAGDQYTGSATFAGEVLLEALELERVVQDVLPHVRSMTEQIVVDDRLVPVSRIVRRCVEELAALAAEAGVGIEFGGDGAAPRVRCDEAAIGRALSSLLRNAIEFTRPGTVVHVDVDLRPDSALALVVEDAGPGADPEHIALCLMPLDLRGGQGLVGDVHLGLGLPLAKAIAQAHGGTVEVGARPGGGTRASIVLPAEIVEACELDDVA